MMNLQDFFSGDQPLQSKKDLKPFRVGHNHEHQNWGLLKEHITVIPALLICVTGEIVFEDEHGKSEILLPADIINIEPQVKHRVVAKKDSLLFLIK
ncbi:MAG: hypothetical protein IPP04_03155 [Saprospiraceae bacterium]|nr:hypothetical protein [Saprospiraceae bacterium]